MQDGNDDERIRERAHQLWERDGMPEGEHERHWRQASEELRAENSGVGSGDSESVMDQGLSSGLQPGGTTPGGGPAPGADAMGVKDKRGAGVRGPD